ncbi:MAG: TRAP transporter substrate-binding protein [Pseudomonadota bacterium]
MEEMQLPRILFFIFLLVAPQAWADTLKVAYHRDLNTPSGRALSVFANEVEACTKGEITIKLFPGGQLANPNEAVTGVAQGTIEMALVPASSMQLVNPVFGVLSVPLVFNNRQHWEAALSGDAAKALSDLAASRGLKSLGFAGGAQFGILSINPIQSLADLEGKSIRSPGQSGNVLASLGAAPRSIAFAEVLSALQTGVVDSAELTPAAARQIKADEVAKSYARTNHRILTELFVINADRFAGLNEEAQKCVTSEAAKAMEIARKTVVEEEIAVLAAFADQGMNVTRLKDRSEMFERGSVARDGIVGELKAGPLFNLIAASASCPDSCTADDCDSSTCQMCKFCE